jgi:steroid delta-isomerase-like uncharacterized protein
MSNKSQIVADFIDKVLNGDQIDATGDYFWEDMVEQAPFPGQGQGVEGLKDVLRMIKAGFPDIHWNVEEQIEEGDKVVTRFIWTGTHNGDFMGVPASGNKVSVWGIAIDRFDGDKIRDTRIIMDTLGLMMQIGAIPAPPSA